MKLTPVKLYTVNYHRDGKLDADVPVWAETYESAARQFVEAHPCDDGKLVCVMHYDGDQTFRIDPDPSPVPSFGWVPGEPPKDGKFYLVQWHGGHRPRPDLAEWSQENSDFCDAEGGYYRSNGITITHHNPTPISLEIP